MNKNIKAVWIGASLAWLLLAATTCKADIYGFGCDALGDTKGLYAMDATSMVVTQVLGEYPDIAGSTNGCVDTSSGTLYQDVTTKSEGTRQIYAIDIRTGDLLSSPVPDTGDPNREIQEQYAFDGKLYAFGINWDPLDLLSYTNELYLIDTTSGVATVLGAYPDLAFHSAGCVDQSNGRLYKDVITKSDGTNRLYVIDIRTGDLLASPVLDTGDTNRGIQELLSFDGKLYAFGLNENPLDPFGDSYTNELYAIDATSGVVTQVLGAYPDLAFYCADSGGFDPTTGILYKDIEAKSDGKRRLYAIDIRTGDLLSSPILETAHLQIKGAANWTVENIYVMPSAPVSVESVYSDYDGNGKSDLAFFHDGDWTIYLMGSGNVISGPFGEPDWTPVR